MFSKRYSIFITVLFCAFLGVFALAQVILPDRTFSENENRNLQQMPALELGTPELPGRPGTGNFFNGKFMSDFETYLTDQFPLRDSWITLKAATELALGKRENNGVYFGSEDTLFAKFTISNPTLAQENLTHVNTLADNLDVPVYFSLIPGKEVVWADRLPANAPNDDGMAFIQQAQESTSSAIWFDTASPLLSHSDEYVFYRTDHHWTSLGAYYGYAALMEAMGMEPVPLEEYDRTTVSDSFLGTTYSSSGAGWITPDSMDTYVPDEGISVITYPEGAPVEGSLYDYSKLEVKDKYSMFLGGNTPLAVISTQHTDAPKVLVIRDSYSDSLAPFLTAHFSEIHLFDTRYNRMPISSYVEANGIDMVVVLFSTSNFVAEQSIFQIAMGA